MKKNLVAALLLLFLGLHLPIVNSQNCYWVLLADKAGTTFDPYSYFDSKAIERYRLNNADLFDISNYPLNESYVQQVDAIATEEVGQSRWLNAVAVMASDEEIAAIARLHFVLRTDIIATEMEIAECRNARQPNDNSITNLDSQKPGLTITDQLLRMEGDLFVKGGIDGKGVRVAVFDGGFHAVNTHAAFKHLRDNNQIVATWDFTKKRENVYDRHTHGTMVLSCIAGRLGERQLGLATGATFLLAKTEVDPEPFKEEVWWAQAVEWADKNGADIINSSLGYGKDRHYTWEMDGRSYVAKAANMAARKGMLVCNSAGNEGDDSKWKCIITPADADSVICVGGINPSLKSYSHISFSSYGPSSDGRLKPNVCNFGYCEVADPHNDTATDFAYGTSFASPLTAGFCACAYQAMRGTMTNAMQMKQLIEESGDLYPYYDYALGYGVPQASFFTDESKRTIEHAATFQFEERGQYLLVQPAKVTKPRNASLDFKTTGMGAGKADDVVMFKIQDRQGRVERYVNLGIPHLDETTYIAFPKAAIWGYDLVVHVNGFTNRYRLSKLDSIYFSNENHEFEYHVIDTTGFFKDDYTENGNRSLADNTISNWGVGQRYLSEGYIQYGMKWIFGSDDPLHYSDAWNIGLRVMHNFKKWYSLGLGLEVEFSTFRYAHGSPNTWDRSLQLTDFSNVEHKHHIVDNVNLEFFQRIRIMTGGMMSKGLHWDLGVFAGLQESEYRISYSSAATDGASSATRVSYDNVKPRSYYDWGLTTRLVWDCIGLYGRYRMSQPDLDLPRLELGLQLSF